MGGALRALPLRRRSPVECRRRLVRGGRWGPVVDLDISHGAIHTSATSQGVSRDRYRAASPAPPKRSPVDRDELEALVEALIEEAPPEQRRRHRRYGAGRVRGVRRPGCPHRLEGGAASLRTSSALAARSSPPPQREPGDRLPQRTPAGSVCRVAAGCTSSTPTGAEDARCTAAKHSGSCVVAGRTEDRVRAATTSR